MQYYNNSNIKYSIAFTDKFNNYKVEIADIISSNNNINTSYIYANIVPVNSSKILLGNEFNLNYKSSYGNQMKTLISSIELISMNYMGSSNNTMYKFGMEYGYIALAMGNMLKDTNKNIKNIEVDGTNAIAIDWNFGCDLVVVGTILLILSLIIFFPPGGLVGITAILGGSVVLSAESATLIFIILTSLSLDTAALSLEDCFNMF